MVDTTRMDDESLARAIAKAVSHEGGRTYYVGGFVRDQILGRHSKDVDIEVFGVPVSDLEELLAGFGEVTTVGASFGIFNLKGHTLDIAVPRRAGTDHRGGKNDLAEVADPSLSTREAALRRDLTMNALYQDVLTGEVVDLVGGRADMEAGVIRHVDDDTFAEDPLRVMRVAQFAARFDMTVDASTVALCSRLDLSDLPSERVQEELRKALLKAERPSVFFEVLRDMHQLDPWFVEVRALEGVPQNPMYHPEGDVWAHTMLVLDAAAHQRDEAADPFAFMLSALCHDFGKAATTGELDGRVVSYGHEKAGEPLTEAFLDRLGVSGSVRAYVLNMVSLHMAPNALVAQGARRKAFNHLFDQSVCPRDLLLLARADDLGRGFERDRTDEDAELLERLRSFEELMARPFVQGRDLVAQGMEPGPMMGEVLRYVHKLRLAGLSKDDQLRQGLGFWRGLLRERGMEG